MTHLSPAPRVLIPLDGSWSRIGAAFIEVDARTGMRLLRLELFALAGRVYVPLAEIHALDLSVPEEPPSAAGPRRAPLERVPAAGQA